MSMVLQLWVMAEKWEINANDFRTFFIYFCIAYVVYVDVYTVSVCM